MSRDYEHERFRPWYLPDTAGWLTLSLGARGVVAELLRKFDDRGQLRLKRLADLAILLRLRWEGELEPAVRELLEAGRVTWDEATGVLYDPDFAERMRQGSAARMARKRRRDSTPPPSEVVPVADVTPVTDVTASDASDGSGACDVTSTLLSSSLISSDLKDPEIQDSARARGSMPPPWAATAVDALAMSTGETFDAAITWAKYQAGRERDGKPMTEADYRAFLASWAARQKTDRVERAGRRGQGGGKFGDRQGLPSAAEVARWAKTGTDGGDL